MKALVQRVKKASVTINNELYSEIASGLLVFLGVTKFDTVENGDKLAQKLAKKLNVPFVITDATSLPEAG